MHTTKLIIYILAALAGGAILLVSLVSATSEFLPTGKVAATQHSFYLSSDILPDHIAYPLLMVADQVRLKLTPFPDKVWLQVGYGWRRLNYTRQLLKKGKSRLAVVAFTKSEKYLLIAAQQSLDLNLKSDIKRKLLTNLTLYIADAKMMTRQFEGADKAVVDQLLDELETLKIRLSESL